MSIIRRGSLMAAGVCHACRSRCLRIGEGQLQEL